MAGADHLDGTRVNGLLSSLKKLVATLVAVGQTRLQLLAGEVHAESQRVTQLLALGAAAVFFFAGGVLLLTLLVIVVFWDSNRLLAIAAITLFYFAIGSGFALAARRSAAAGSRLFEASLAELRKDCDRLSA
jgi:uncharacterized membrane protein YqjE